VKSVKFAARVGAGGEIYPLSPKVLQQGSGSIYLIR